MTNYSPPSGDFGPPGRRSYWSAVPPWYAVVAVLLLTVILVTLVFLVLRDEGDQVQTVASTTSSSTPTLPSTTSTSVTSETSATASTATSSTTASTTSSTSASTTSTTSSSTSTTVDPAVYASAVWPWVGSSVRYDDPVRAATGFAEDFVGFDDPVVGTFQQGDSRSGEVEVRPDAEGPVTTVFVRRLGPDDTWWVLGSATANIVVTEPDALEIVDSPLRVAGEALAFEGVVDLELRADGSTTPLIDDVVVGGGDALRPFDGEFTWTNPGEGSGALLLSTHSMDDGDVNEAAVLRVVFATD